MKGVRSLMWAGAWGVSLKIGWTAAYERVGQVGQGLRGPEVERGDFLGQRVGGVSVRWAWTRGFQN